MQFDRVGIDKTEIAYGKTTIGVPLPDGAGILIPPIAKVLSNVWEEELNIALEESNPSMEAYLKKGKDVLLIIPDRTRKCNLKLILPTIISRIINSGIDRKNITLLIACGTHKKTGIAEYISIIGEGIVSKHNIIEHDCDHFTSRIGTTKRGTPIEINPLLLDYDRIIAIGGTLPHYFAGFGGGPKLVFPGCAGRKSILANHRFSIHLQDGYNVNLGETGVEQNELMADIIEAVSKLPEIYHIGLVLDSRDIPYKFFCGEIIDSYKEMIQDAGMLFSREVDQQADVVIASAGGYPKDIDLLQAHKSILHASAALKKGGILIMFAECINGIGSPTLAKLIELESMEKVKDELAREYVLNGQAALSLFRLGKNFRVKVVTELDNETMKRIGFSKVSADDIQDEIEALIEKKVYFIPQSANTIVRILKLTDRN